MALESQLSDAEIPRHTFTGCWGILLPAIVPPTHTLPTAEEALGERRDEGDLDEQADHRLQRCQHRDRVVERQPAAGEEAAPVERGDAEDQRGQWRIDGVMRAYAERR